MNARRAVGLLLLAAGIILCAAAGWHYLHGYLAQRQARADFERRLAHPAPPTAVVMLPGPTPVATLSGPTPEATLSGPTPVPTLPAVVENPGILAPVPVPTPRGYPYGQPLARLRIPAAGIDQIVFGGCDQDTLARGPGHVPGTALPGTDGPPRNCVITGHRDSHFRHLGWLRRGSLVELDTPAGETKYRIVEREIVKPDAVSVLAPTSQPRLTLITCYPFTYIGPAPQRLVLVAEPIASRASRHKS